MHKTPIKCFLIAAVTCFSIAGFAESWSGRITVTTRGHGPDVLLITGDACSAAVWDTTAAHLEGRFRLHIIQMNGFAGTQAMANADGPVVQPTVNAIAAYIKANGLKSPKVIGHSLGGTMGLMLALQHPGDVRSLMIVSALPFSGVMVGADNVTQAGEKATRMRDDTVEESEKHYALFERMFIRTLVKSPEDRHLATQWAVASDKSVVARATYEDMMTDLRPGLHNLKTPVTIVYPWDPKSSYSQVETEWMYQSSYAALQNKTFVQIDNSLHYIMFDQPDAFLAQVDQFVASH